MMHFNHEDLFSSLQATMNGHIVYTNEPVWVHGLHVS